MICCAAQLARPPEDKTEKKGDRPPNRPVSHARAKVASVPCSSEPLKSLILFSWGEKAKAFFFFFFFFFLFIKQRGGGPGS